MAAQVFRARSAELTGAFDTGAFLLHYQPQFDIADGNIAGFEALVRWDHPDQGLLTAGAFISEVETSGLSRRLFDLVLQDACHQARNWADAELPDGFKVWVNVSGRQLVDHSLPGDLAAGLAASGTPADLIGVEVMETALLEDEDGSVEVLCEVRDMGVELAIDDFGTGYASLSWLKRFPVDVVKIDQSFVKGLGHDPEDDAIVTAVLTLAHGLGVRVVAEGVETPRQLAELRARRCDSAQGFLMAPPAAAGDVAAAFGDSSGGRTVLDAADVEASLERLARSAGADDLFVLRDAGGGQLLDVAGVGRGKGWAGIVQADARNEPLIHEAIQRTEIVRVESLTRVFGPYWTESAALTTVGPYLVVLGGGDVSNAGDDVVLSAAAGAGWCGGQVPTEKRLADEREFTDVALSVARLRPGSLSEAAQALAESAATALSCEFAAVLLDGPPPTLHLAPSSWRPDASDEAVIDALRLLRDAVTADLVVEQDTSGSPNAAHPLAFDDGLLARVAVPLGDGGNLGVLVAAHTTEAPRGFTMLCRRIAEAIGEQGTVVLSSVLER